MLLIVGKKLEWFEDNVHILTHLINTRNAAHNRIFSFNSIAARKAFRLSQQRLKKVVDKVKESWILSAAKEA